MNIEIANRLQQMRKKNNLSQEELASKIGVTRQAVSKWERAESSPDMENLILLAKLYGVSIDELINSGISPEPVSAGISLKKGDYGFDNEPVREVIPENYTDKEIYPNVSTEAENSIPQGSPFGVDVGEEEKSENGSRVEDDLKKSVEKAGRAIGDMLNLAGQKLGESMKKRENGTDNKAQTDMQSDEWEIKFEKEMSKAEKKLEEEFEKFGEKMWNLGDKLDRKLNASGKPVMPLLDKLFPLLAVMIFFCTIPLNLAHPGWTVFLLIPLYYTTKNALKKRNIMLFCYPVFCVWLYFFFGGLLAAFIPSMADNWYGFGWLIFLTIPLFYTAIPALKKRNPLIFCYPVLCVLVYLGVGLFFDNVVFMSGLSNWWFGTMWLPIFMTIPIYYIVLDHFRKKNVQTNS